MARSVNLGESAALRLISPSPARTRRIGRRLGELAGAGDLFCLRGPLGAGKTVFAQGLAQGLGAADGLVSPSFTLVHEHRARGGLACYHVDLYRLSPEAVGELGLEDYLERGGVVVIEWAERAPSGLLGDRLEVEFAFGQGLKERELTFRPVGARAAELARRLSRLSPRKADQG